MQYSKKKIHDIILYALMAVLSFIFIKNIIICTINYKNIISPASSFFSNHSIEKSSKCESCVNIID